MFSVFARVMFLEFQVEEYAGGCHGDEVCSELQRLSVRYYLTT